MVTPKRPKPSAIKTSRERINPMAIFNPKGGVSKTTTTFNLGWMLAAKGHRVVLVDSDPQCSLSGLVLGYQGQDQGQRSTDRPYSSRLVDFVKEGRVGFPWNFSVHGGNQCP